MKIVVSPIATRPSPHASPHPLPPRHCQVAARASKFRSDVAGQLAEKEAARLAALEAQRAELSVAMAELEIRQARAVGWDGSGFRSA